MVDDTGSGNGRLPDGRADALRRRVDDADERIDDGAHAGDAPVRYAGARLRDSSPGQSGMEGRRRYHHRGRPLLSGRLSSGPTLSVGRAVAWRPDGVRQVRDWIGLDAALRTGPDRQRIFRAAAQLSGQHRLWSRVRPGRGRRLLPPDGARRVAWGGRADRA